MDFRAAAMANRYPRRAVAGRKLDFQGDRIREEFTRFPRVSRECLYLVIFRFLLRLEYTYAPPNCEYCFGSNYIIED